MFRKFFLILALLTPFFINISTSSPSMAEEKKVVVRLLPEKTALKGGETVTIGVQQKIRQGWHTYWANPGDSGAIARIKWEGVKNIEAAPIQWPMPKRLPMGPLMNFGYEGEVTLLQDITLPQNLPGGAQTITANIDILVCDEICIPESHTASFTINGHMGRRLGMGH